MRHVSYNNFISLTVSLYSIVLEIIDNLLQIRSLEFKNVSVCHNAESDIIIMKLKFSYLK